MLVIKWTVYKNNGKTIHGLFYLLSIYDLQNYFLTSQTGNKYQLSIFTSGWMFNIDSIGSMEFRNSNTFLEICFLSYSKLKQNSLNYHQLSVITYHQSLSYTLNFICRESKFTYQCWRLICPIDDVNWFTSFNRLTSHCKKFRFRIATNFILTHFKYWFE